MKEVLLPIHPEHCFNIGTGKKKIEIRKRHHCPEPPFKCYVYCTLPSKTCQHVSGCIVINTDELFRLPDGRLKHDWSGEVMVYPSETWGPDNFLNGKVIGEFTCNREIVFSALPDYSFTPKQIEEICVSREKLEAYGTGKQLSGLIIENFRLYDHPLTLSEIGISRAPQSWCYVKKEREK